VPSLGAQEQQTIVLDRASIPGILPGSSFYFVKTVERTVHLAFAFNAPKRSELTSQFAFEDALAIEELCQMREYSLAAQHCDQFLNHFQEAVSWLERTIEEGKGNQKMVEELKEDHFRQQQILVDVLEKMPEEKSGAVFNAIEGSNCSMEDAIKTAVGEQEAKQFRQEVNLQLADVNELIQTQISEKPETGEPEETLPLNHAPSIVNFLSDAKRVDCLEKCNIICEAQDDDYDPLSYAWSASGGDISITGKDPVVTWTAPENDGKCTISVTVSDGKGGETTASLDISVATVPPLTIEKFLLTPEDPGHFTMPNAFTENFTILWKKNCSIECVITGSRDVNYEWSVNHGDIIANEAEATWIAPDYKTDITTVTVVVTDDYGGKVTEQITFKVSDCPVCFSHDCLGEELPLVYYPD